MNPRTAMDCIACAVMPTAVWLIPVARQNRITRSCAVSFVVAFAMAYSLHPPARYAAGGGGGGFGGLGGGGFGGFGGSMGTLRRPVALRYWMTHDAADKRRRRRARRSRHRSIRLRGRL